MTHDIGRTKSAPKPTERKKPSSINNFSNRAGGCLSSDRLPNFPLAQTAAVAPSGTWFNRDTNLISLSAKNWRTKFRLRHEKPSA
jgi:hypothetical protein